MDNESCNRKREVESANKYVSSIKLDDLIKIAKELFADDPYFHKPKRKRRAKT